MNRLLNTDYKWNIEESKLNIFRSKFPVLFIGVPLPFFVFLIFYIYNRFFKYINAFELVFDLRIVFILVMIISLILFFVGLIHTYKVPRSTIIEKDRVTRNKYIGKAKVFKSDDISFHLEERRIGGRYKHFELHLFFRFKDSRFPVLSIKDYGIDSDSISDLINAFKCLGHDVEAFKTK